MMDKELIKKLSIFDFDGTLIDTISPEEGKKIWKEKTGTDYPHKGWWGKRETLDIDIFENKPFDDIVADFNQAVGEPNTYTALCTGRIVPLKKEVHAILNKYGFVFDEVVLNGDKRFVKKGEANDTLAFKIRFLDDLVSRFPNLEELEFWDDRDKHNPTFVQWGKMQTFPVTINHVHQSENRG